MTAPPVAPGLFEVDGDALVLVGGYSASSGHHHFPLAERCPYTGAGDVERVALPRTGRLWLWTAVQAAPPGYLGVVPYGYGVVELDGVGLRVIGRLLGDDLAEGTPMHVVAEEVPGDDGPVTTWAFSAS